MPRVQGDWNKYAGVGHVIGDRDAQVTIVEFADFECPFCRKFDRYVDSLRTLGTKLRVVFRHFPIPGHRFAIPAARASECASDQGHFAEMYSALFANADSLGAAPWWWFAKRAGVADSSQFAACIRSPGLVRAVSRDSADARHLGIVGTPLLLIGPTRLDGVPTFDSLRIYVARAVGSDSGDRRR